MESRNCALSTLSNVSRTKLLMRWYSISEDSQIVRLSSTLYSWGLNGTTIVVRPVGEAAVAQSVATAAAAQSDNRFIIRRSIRDIPAEPGGNAAVYSCFVIKPLASRKGMKKDSVRGGSIFCRISPRLRGNVMEADVLDSKFWKLNDRARWFIMSHPKLY